MATLVGLVAALFSWGCGPYIDEVNAEHRAKVEPILRDLAAVGPVLAKTPTATANTPPDASIRLVLSGSWSAEGNAVLIYAEDFRNFDELGLVYARLPNADFVQRGAAALHTEREPWDPARPESTPSGEIGSAAERIYTLLEGVEFLVVLRTRAFAKPHVGLPKSAPRPALNTDAGADAGATRTDAGADSGATGSSEKYAYSGGYLGAELLYFRIADKQLAGATLFEAESSESITGAPTDRVLEADLKKNVRTALKDALAKQAPNVKVVE